MTDTKTTAALKAPLSRKIGYGFGDMSSSMFWKIFTAYLPFFYSTIFGLSLVDATFLMLVTRVWDAVSDPMMGIIADRTQTKWGKYRPYLLWIALPFAVTGVCNIHPYDDGLYGYQRPLRSHARRDDSGLRREDGILFIPYVLRLCRKFRGPCRMGTSLQDVQQASGYREFGKRSFIMAICNDSGRYLLSAALPALLQDDKRDRQEHAEGKFCGI